VNLGFTPHAGDRARGLDGGNAERVAYLRISSKRSSALGSSLWPSQKGAVFLSSESLLVRAIRIKAGTPSSGERCESAKIASWCSGKSEERRPDGDAIGQHQRKERIAGDAGVTGTIRQADEVVGGLLRAKNPQVGAPAVGKPASPDVGSNRVDPVVSDP